MNCTDLKYTVNPTPYRGQSMVVTPGVARGRSQSAPSKERLRSRPATLPTPTPRPRGPPARRPLRLDPSARRVPASPGHRSRACRAQVCTCRRRFTWPSLTSTRATHRFLALTSPVPGNMLIQGSLQTPGHSSGTNSWGYRRDCWVVRWTRSNVFVRLSDGFPKRPCVPPPRPPRTRPHRPPAPPGELLSVPRLGPAEGAE